nr:glycosyltransferase family 2 protein [Ardenticatena sp.]
MPEPTVSVVVLTRNEERHLPGCLETLGWADEVLVLDSGSTDRTLAIARAAGVRIEERAFTHFGDQRQAALEMAQGAWVFFVDADERVPPELAAEVRRVVQRHRPEVGWWVPRRNFFWGKEVRHTGWFPDYQLRLLKKGYARYDRTELVHEVATVEGETGYLQTPLVHLNYDSWREFFAKQAAYARYEADRWVLEGRRVRWRTFVLQPIRGFWRRYVRWQGWRDGLLGLQLSLAMAWFEWEVARLVWQRQREMSRTA